jgi:hypothetical protein
MMKKMLLAVALIGMHSPITIAKNPNAMLKKAVEDNDLDQVQVAIKAGGNVNQKVDRGLIRDSKETLLHVAATPRSFLRGFINPEILTLLLENGAKKNINEKDALGRTPLFQAANGGNTQAVKILLKNGANPNILDEKGRTIWSELQAKKNKRPYLEIMEMLMQAGAK